MMAARKPALGGGAVRARWTRAGRASTGGVCVRAPRRGGREEKCEGRPLQGRAAVMDAREFGACGGVGKREDRVGTYMRRAAPSAARLYEVDDSGVVNDESRR